MALLNRLPKLSNIAPVYAVAVLMVYGWTMILFLWKLPSWLDFLSLGEILVLLAYSLAVNLLESLCILLIPVLVAVILPRAWFYDLFIARATALVLLGVGYAMFFTLQLQGAVGYPKNLLLLTVPAVAVILALAYGVGKVSIARKVLEAFADRALIFLYFSIPLSLISLCVVAIRNLF